MKPFGRGVSNSVVTLKILIKKREPKPTGKWHLDEQTLRINGKPYILWRAVDSQGYELDVFLQKRRNKRAAIRFLTRLLKSCPQPKVIVTDKLKSYVKPIRQMCKTTLHLKHKSLNNRVENAHQPTRRKKSASSDLNPLKAHNNFYL